MTYLDLKQLQSDDMTAVFARAKSIYVRRPKIRDWDHTPEPDRQHYLRLAEQELWAEGALNFEPESLA